MTNNCTEENGGIHHQSIISAQNAIAGGMFGKAEIAQFFFARWDLPMQVAIRDLMTGRIKLLDLHEDGSLSPST